MKWIIAFLVGAGIAYGVMAADPKVTERMIVCAESAGIASDIQIIRQIEVQKDQTHAFEDFKADVSAPMLVIIGQMVFEEYEASVLPTEVYEQVMEQCLNEVQIKRGPSIPKDPSIEYEV